MYNINDRVGKLTLIDKKRENNRTWFLCKCDCGNEKWIRADAIGKPTLSCGCLSKKTQFKAKDLVNEKFGRLTVVKITNKRDKNNGSVIWECKCDCGKIAFVSEGNLKNKRIISCGCYSKENSSNNIKKAVKEHLDRHIVEDTNLQVITREAPIKSNTSGVTGVRWDKNRNKWVASIIFKKKTYYLGRYKNKEDAIKARKEAEEKLIKPFLESLEDSNGNNKKSEF